MLKKTQPVQIVAEMMVVAFLAWGCSSGIIELDASLEENHSIDSEIESTPHDASHEEPDGIAEEYSPNREEPIGGEDGSTGFDDSSSGIDTAEPVCKSLKIVVMSDMNLSYCTAGYPQTVFDAVSAIKDRIKPDLVLIPGDMVPLESASCTNSQREACWTSFRLAVYEPLTNAGIPVVPSPGNHDAAAGFPDDEAAYETFWNPRTPQVTIEDQAVYPYRFTFTHKGAFFISMYANYVGNMNPTQKSWIDAQLAAQSNRPIKIAFGHVPIHPVTVGRETEILNDLELEGIFKKHNLTLYFTGHHHGYYPAVAGGVRQVSTSCFNGFRPLIGTSENTKVSIIVVTIENDQVISLEAYLPSDYTTPIRRADLPNQIVYGSHTLERDDLAGF